MSEMFLCFISSPRSGSRNDGVEAFLISLAESGILIFSLQ